MSSAISQSLEGLVISLALLYAISNVNIVTALYLLAGVFVITKAKEISSGSLIFKANGNIKCTLSSVG